VVLILGIDPGTATTGYGFVREADDGALLAVAYGVILTKAGVPMPERLLKLYNDLTALIQKHQPDEMAIEQLFFGKNVTTGITVAQARGVMLLAGEQAKLPMREYKPAEVKMSVAGYGDADKVQVQVMIQQLLELDAPPKPDDAADALAVAITHLNSTRFERMM
jgi:crossover junction endodeoxyribonuclease RuvC